jgi:hypothetical protein
MTRGEYAELVKTFPKMFQDLLFKSYRPSTGITAEQYTKDWNENKWEDCFVELEKLKDYYFGGN